MIVADQQRSEKKRQQGVHCPGSSRSESSVTSARSMSAVASGIKQSAIKTKKAVVKMAKGGASKSKSASKSLSRVVTKSNMAK